MRVFADVGHVSQYSKTILWSWGMKVSRPLDGDERRLARKIGFAGAAKTLEAMVAGLSELSALSGGA